MLRRLLWATMSGRLSVGSRSATEPIARELLRAANLARAGMAWSPAVNGAGGRQTDGRRAAGTQPRDRHASRGNVPERDTVSEHGYLIACEA